MGKINQGPFGSVSGLVGNLIGGTWKGQGYFRIRPSKVKNPNTPKQARHRACFAKCVAFAKLINLSSIIK
jgi:hypothetical protein